MKRIKWIAAVCLLATAVYAGEPSEADKKWGEAVEKMIADGVTSISTPAESRAKLAKELAAKHGRECQVEKTATGYKIVLVQQFNKVAKN
jgi:hypothetical protein